MVVAMLEIKDIMSKPVLTISQDKSVQYAAEYMYQNNIGGLPVTERNRLLGIITSRDIRLNHPNRIVADAMNKKALSPIHISRKTTLAFFGELTPTIIIRTSPGTRSAR